MDAETVKAFKVMQEQINDLVQRMDETLHAFVNGKTVLIAGTFDDETAAKVQELYPSWNESETYKKRRQGTLTGRTVQVPASAHRPKHMDAKRRAIAMGKDVKPITDRNTGLGTTGKHKSVHEKRQSEAQRKDVGIYG